MDFIAEFGFDVKQGQAQDFQTWLSENESKFPAACPKGVEYIGTYVVVQHRRSTPGDIDSSSGWRATARRTLWPQR